MHSAVAAELPTVLEPCTGKASREHGSGGHCEDDCCRVGPVSNLLLTRPACIMS